MANYNSFGEAGQLKKRHAQGEELRVEITTGALTGTIARIITIKRKHFDRHDYQLETPGVPAWWQKGDSFILVGVLSQLNYCEDPSLAVVYRDSMNQIITNGTVIFFVRASRAGCGAEAVLATVKKITRQGLDVLPFRVNNKNKVHTQSVLVRKPDSCLMLGKDLPSQVMLSKLAAM